MSIVGGISTKRVPTVAIVATIAHWSLDWTAIVVVTVVVDMPVLFTAARTEYTPEGSDPLLMKLCRESKRATNATESSRGKLYLGIQHKVV